MRYLKNGELPNVIDSGLQQGGHCQGIAVDRKKRCVYYSFTTMLVKTDLKGNLIGSVTGLTGHLGCIALCPADGRVYGSLEYKLDAIGRSILRHVGGEATVEDAFYIAIFDADAIIRPNMDACRDGVMTTVYLSEVVRDYHAGVCHDGRMVSHRLGCSGIDGITFGPVPGENAGKQLLFVAYGVYGDVSRHDNDHQVILVYDSAAWATYEQPLRQEALHRCGPDAPMRKFFVYTGNTEYGVQNLEYDQYTGRFLMAVYPGHKAKFPNHRLYVIDGRVPPHKGLLRGVEPEQEGELLALWPQNGEETPGFEVAYGSRGLCSLGDGTYYLAHDYREGDGYGARLFLYGWDGVTPLAKIKAAGEKEA